MSEKCDKCGKKLTVDDYMKRESDDEFNRIFLGMCDGGIGDFNYLGMGMMGIKEEAREKSKQKILDKIKNRKCSNCPK